MNDLEIKEYLMGYISEEMELLQEKDMQGYEHVFSKKFDKRIRKSLKVLMKKVTVIMLALSIIMLNCIDTSVAGKTIGAYKCVLKKIRIRLLLIV